MMLEAVHSSEFFLQLFKGYNRTKQVNYLLNNMRMTICELV